MFTRMPQRAPKTRQSAHYWKIAFFVLASALVLALLFLLRQVTYSPDSSHQAGQNQQSNAAFDESAVVDVQFAIAYQQMETVMNQYLSRSKDFTQPLQVEIAETITAKGEANFLGLRIPYTVRAVPYAMDNGNIQLKIANIAIGQLHLPKTQALNLLNNQVDFPDFVTIDANTHTAEINLNGLTVPHLASLHLLQIDSANENFRFEARISLENLVE